MTKLKGRVQKGLGIGRTLGYPTANLSCEAKVLPSSKGVYAAYATMGKTRYEAVAVIGARFDKGTPLVEVHLFDFKGDLRKKELEVELFDKVSEIEKFVDDEQLKRKIEEDVKKVRLCLQG